MSANQRVAIASDDGVDKVSVVAKGIYKALVVSDSTISAGGVVSPLDTGNICLGSDGTNYRILSTDSSGHLQVDVLSGGGGGTQYTEGDTDASITGTAILWEDAANTLVTVNSAKPLPISGAITGTVSVSNMIPAVETGLATSAKQLADGHNVTIDNSTGGSAVNIQDGGNTITVDGAVTTSGTVTEASASAIKTAVEALDNAVDGNYLNVNLNVAGTDVNSGAGTEANALRVTIANDSTGLISIDDNGGAITVDGTVAVTNAGITSIDGKITACNTGAVVISSGTITTITNSVAVTNAGITTIAGAVTGTEMQCDVLTMPTITVNSHAVTNAGTFAVQVDGNALTSLQLIDNAVDGNYLNVNLNVAGTDVNSGAGTEANALRVTIANDSTGVLSIDDNGGAITVDGTVTATHGITGIAHGVQVVTTAGTDVALAASTPCKRVTIQAQTDNTSWIAVGTSGVDATIATGTGVMLGAGDAYELEIDNLADVYIDSLVNGEGVRYCYFT